jgi:protease I
MSKKIAVLITDEFEDSEFTSPAEAFRKAGHEVVTIEKQAGKTVTGKKGEASVTIDKAIDETRPADYDALLLPGGHSPDYLRGDDRFVTFTRDFINSGKPVLLSATGRSC